LVVEEVVVWNGFIGAFVAGILLKAFDEDDVLLTTFVFEFDEEPAVVFVVAF
jgi:hypothetical protein